MNLRERLFALSNNQLIAGFIVAIATLVVSPIASYYILKYVEERENGSKGQTIETVTVEDLGKAIQGAKVKIEATGYYLSQIEPDTIDRVMLNSPKLTAKIAMVDPLAGKAICQRQYDEDNVSRNYNKIIQKVKEFRQKCRSLIDDRRLKVASLDF
jgi:hypothetical protein